LATTMNWLSPEDFDKVGTSFDQSGCELPIFARLWTWANPNVHLGSPLASKGGRGAGYYVKLL
jgi:hypothetical protein